MADLKFRRHFYSFGEVMKVTAALNGKTFEMIILSAIKNIVVI